MAEHGRVETADATAENYAAHEQTYRLFVKLVKWTLGVVVVILILMAIFLT
jgi:membrane protein required for beta-lactamase induction